MVTSTPAGEGRHALRHAVNETPISTPGLRPDAPLEDLEDARLRASIGARLFGRSERVTVDRFEIEGRLGSGGMGIVYEAWDPRLRRRVALKVVRPDRSAPALHRRLLREARAAARLNHPNVVTIYEVGEASDVGEAGSSESGESGDLGPLVWIAMEFIEGLTLRRWVEAAPRTDAELVALFLGAGRGLAAAHREGLVHRDFKPENVLVEDRPDGSAHARVVDFGLAVPAQAGALESNPTDPNGRALPGTQPEHRPTSTETPNTPRPAYDDEHTALGRASGTPAYMAPEQTIGEPVDAQADQFAFCVALYESFEGHRPFAGRSLLEIWAEIEAGRLRPACRVPRWLRPAIRRGLARDPSARFDHMDTLLAVLESGLARRRRGAWIGAGVFAVAGVLTALGLGLSRPGEDPCADADQAADPLWSADAQAQSRAWFEAERSSFRDQSARAFATNVEGWVGRWRGARIETCKAARVEGRQSAELRDLRDACLDRQLRRVHALIRETVATQGSPERVARAVGASSELPSLEDCANTDSLLHEVPIAGGPEARAAARDLDLDLADFEGAFPTTDPKLSMARARTLSARAAELAPPHPPTSARALLAGARAALVLGQRERALKSFGAAFREAVRGRSERVAAEAALMAAFAQIQHHDDTVDAARWLGDADAFIDALGEQPQLRATWLDHSGILAVVESRYDDAEDFHRRALALREALPGQAVAVANSRINLAVALTKKGQTEAALAEFELARTIYAEQLGPQHPAVANLLTNIGAVQLEAGNTDQAVILTEEALAIKTSVFGAQDHRLASTLINLANARWALDDREGAVEVLGRAIAVRERALGPTHPRLALPLSNLGASYLEMGRPALALVQYERAITIAQGSHGESHADLLFSRQGRAEALVALDRPVEARAAYVQLVAQAEQVELQPGVHALLLRDAALSALGGDPGERARSRIWAERASTLCASRADLCDADPLDLWTAQAETTQP